MHFTDPTATTVDKVRSFVMDERKTCLSDREWKFRLKGYGYGVHQTDQGRVLTTLPQGAVICAI